MSAATSPRSATPGRAPSPGTLLAPQSNDKDKDSTKEEADNKAENKSENLRLRWRNHSAGVCGAFDALLRANELVDVTLASEGRALKCHKVILSACSPYFR